jgi:hypothetical protein
MDSSLLAGFGPFATLMAEDIGPKDFFEMVCNEIQPVSQAQTPFDRRPDGFA